MHEQSHVIYRLAVHLPNTQALYFNENDSADNLHQKLSKSSTLMEWFKLNQNDQEARNYFYREIPNHYVWETKKTKGTWKPRQRGGENVIGRMYTVSVSDQERYFLRILLLHVKGATSFEYLRTVDGILHSTFKKAAQAHGLLLDDTMWRLTIRDACLLSMPQKLRELFAYICVYGPPTSPLELWQEFKEQFTEDFCHRHTINNSISHESCESFAMREVQNILVLHGRSFKEFDLPEPASHLPCLIEDYDEAYELSMAAEMREILNDGQRAAYNVIIDALEDSESRTPKRFFIDGPGGSGKTFLYELLMHHVRGFNDVVLPSATTGIAANLLTGGRTMHSFYGIPVPINETPVSQIKMDTNAAKLLKTAKLLIIDECTMAHRHALLLIDRLLREVMSESVSLSARFHLEAKTEIVDSCIKQSYLWSNFSRLPLGANMRCSDIDYCEWLLKLGNGELTNEHNLGEDVIEIPSELLCTQSIVIDIFGHQISIDITNTKSIEILASHAILCPKNDDVDLLNSEIMDRITGVDTVYKSDDTVVTDEDDIRENYPVEFLNSLSPSGMPPHRLRLKIGAIVMLLRNLNTKKALCNSTRLIVTNLLPNVIAAKVITGSAAGDDVFIPRIDLCPSEIKLPFRLKRRQFPIKLAFAMTINKFQGQSLKKLEYIYHSRYLVMANRMFEKFDENLENVENYIYRLKQFMLISKTKEDFKTPFLISSIGPKYFGILQNLVFPEEVDQVPFDKLCKILLKHFNPKTNIIYERFVFQKMDQKSGEAISKYIIRLKEQAQRCNFGDFLQESLRDRFVAGIIDTPTQKKLLQEEGLTFEGALDIALSAESADNDLHNLKRSEDAHWSPQHLHAINNPCKHCGIKCHLDVKADFIPKFYKFRQVPFALKQLVENEIDKLVDLNILSPIDKSDCASPLVCVAKPNGQIRLCADFKKSLNPYLEDVKYPIPNIDSVLSNFQGKKLFTKLDLSKAYHQIEMDDISKKTLNVHERKYSQVEREGLAIVFAVNKLKNYLFGRKFTIYTDHKPLITIFGDKTNLPPLIANRLHRWALTLSNYSFEIKYKKGKDNIIPDFLSRFPECQEDNLEYNDGSGEILLLNTSIIDHVLVAHETQLDRTLFKLYKIIETGELPSSPNDDLIPYLKRIDDFTILQECIFLENRMVIPKSLHERAEVSVREVKKLLKKQLYENEQVELNLALSRALFFIRTDVNIRKGTSPAELFLGRKIRSRLSVLSKEEVKASKFNSQYVNIRKLSFDDEAMALGDGWRRREGGEVLVVRWIVDVCCEHIGFVMASGLKGLWQLKVGYLPKAGSGDVLDMFHELCHDVRDFVVATMIRVVSGVIGITQKDETCWMAP
ncbi:hypothetical protein LAZ67_8001449 [Cordylochernes scorpioides]|uniref:ATP-dependent DNA helicase n=1 Tax=Cordylochernes scorpioides TaxID=51811 RepID=A0ABY6KQ71_9ARAC|nr:hypothetical protein LAZ67_8001449 [Cordylochernes scorpioides]